MRVGMAFVAGAALAAATFALFPRALAGLDRGADVLVDDQEPPRAGLERWLEERGRAVRARRATLLVDGISFEVTFAELGLSLDVARTEQAVNQLLAQSQQPSSWLGPLRQRIAPSPEALHVPFSFEFDPERAAQRLAPVASDVKREPLDARLDLKAHARIPERPGRELNVVASLARIGQGDRADSSVFELVMRPVPPSVTLDMLGGIAIERVLSSYETEFSHHAGPRAINIATAARYLNGAIIAPLGTFSFNKTVGPRTVERGFTSAPQIVADELEPGVGGGVCQVASTLHAAAVFGGFQVLQRRSHTRPSGYTPLGLDATVVDGELDLKLKNPYPTPLIVHAFLPTPTSLRIELLGRSPEGLVEHFYEVKEKHEFVRRIVVEPGFRQNETKRRQKGLWGYDVVSTVRTTYPNGERRFRSYTSTYYPVPEVYWVGAGTDPSTLPALPEGAQGIEFGPTPESPPG